jgi:hypothetical protein
MTLGTFVKKFAQHVLPISLKLLFAIGVTALTACSTLDVVGTPANPERWLEREVNACLPTAIVFKESLKRYGVWAEVLTYKAYDPIKNKTESHALVVFNYPPGKDSYWTYDYEGSFKMGPTGSSVGGQHGVAPSEAASTGAAIDVRNPKEIAQLAEISRFRSYRNILEAGFLN